MSNTADHSERRKRVIRIARQISLARGLEAMTVRAIARETGFSTAIVSYYFKDKAELSMLVFEEALAISERRFRATIEANLPPSECLCSLLPLDDELRDVWRTWFAFWSLTVSDLRFRTAQVERTELLVATLREVLIGQGNCSSDNDAVARRLFAAILGISVQAVHDPARWPPEQQVAMLEAEIRAVLSAG